MALHSEKLHLGCGLTTPDSWLNVDGSFNARLARYPLLNTLARALTGRQNAAKFAKNIYGHDLRKPLPWGASTFQAIYASHLLEHLYRDDAIRLLKESFRVLKPGGVIRVVVPDLAPLVSGYLTGTFPEWLNDRPEVGETGVRGDRMIQALLMRDFVPPSGNLLRRWYEATYDFHSHKWMYDAESLCHLVKSAGFKDVEPREYKQSRIEKIEEVEYANRVINGAGVVAEGVKP